MVLATQVGTLATRIGEEFNALRNGLPVNLDGWPIYCYGDSYLLTDSHPYYTDGSHMLDLVQSRVNAGAVTTYAVGGTFIMDVVGGLIDDSAIAGSAGQAVGALWPGVSSRSGLLVLDTIVNDIVHSIGGVYAPWVISDSDTMYIDGLRGMYRSALALMSSESRIEAAAATRTGTWSQVTSAAYSGGSIYRSNAVGSKAAFTVTPPQSGIMAGRVFFLTAKVNAVNGTMATMKIDVDGAKEQYYTPNAWEGGLSTAACYDCVAVDMPVDNAPHTLNVTHVGNAGEYVYADGLAIPSLVPNPILVMGGEHPIKVGAWDASQVAMYARNIVKVLPVLKAVVGEFGNAIYVRSPLTPNGIYSTDGVHPNDRGQQQRAAAVISALALLRPWFEANRLSALPDANFGVV